MQKKGKTLEPQHLAAEMYSVQSFVASKVNNKNLETEHTVGK